MSTDLPCPLCEAREATEFFRDKRRTYMRCERCLLVYVPPEFYLSREAERREYELHDNDIGDPGYRRFLSRLAEPLQARLETGARGLDFGCGPGPALAEMLREAGFPVALYDPFFQPETDVLEQDYDFITATEVVEHLHWPGQELRDLWQRLRPGGVLGIMTKLVIDREAFSRWHYKNDQTHVVFFSETTWQWWAQEYGARYEQLAADVSLLTRV